MKMKKCFALLAALAMTFSLSCPALAVNGDDLVISPAPDYDYYEDYTDAYYNGYDAGYDAGETKGHADGLAGRDYASAYTYDYDRYTTYADGYNNGYADGYDVGYDNGLADGYIAAHPVKAAAFDANAYYQEYYASYFDSKAEFMDYWELSTEEEFRQALLRDWAQDQLLEEAIQAQRDEEISALGGVPGQLGVLFNGKYLTFPDVTPEAKNGRTMLPLRAVTEGMGGTAEWDSATNQVTCVLNGATLTFAVGGDTVSVLRADGSTDTITMDCASYSKWGRTMVPLRFISQAAGYDVYWDQDYKTAVVIDPAALAAAVDKDFSVLNRALSAQTNTGDKTYASTVSMKLACTLLDSIKGNKTYAFSANASGISDGQDLQMSGSMDLSQLTTLLKDLAGEDFMSSLTLTQKAKLAAMLKDAKFQLLLDGDKGALSLFCPILTYLNDYDDGTNSVWLTTTDETIPALLATYSGRSFTMGQLIYLISTADDVTDAFHLWADCADAGDALAAMMGDKCFTAQGTGYTLAYTLADYHAYLQNEYEEYYDEDYDCAFDKLDLRFTVAADGSVTGSVSLLTKADSYGSPAIQAEGTLALSPARCKLDASIQVKNVMDLKLNIDSTSAVTSQKPTVTPPAGAKTVDLDDLAVPYDPAAL